MKQFNVLLLRQNLTRMYPQRQVTRHSNLWRGIASIGTQRCYCSVTSTTTLSLSTDSSSLIQQHRSFGTRGARGHGWYVNYRAGKGGRHLQGEYYDREDVQQCMEWNQSILQLGSQQVYMDVVLEPASTSTKTKASNTVANAISNNDATDASINDDATDPSSDDDAPDPYTRNKLRDVRTLSGEKVRLVIDVATEVMPETTKNFIDLCCNTEVTRYIGSIMYRVERNAGIICGGDVLTNTGRNGKAAYPKSTDIDEPTIRFDIANDPLVMWHIPGTISMIVPKVGTVDSRFMLCTQLNRHLDGTHRAFGQLSPESLEIVHNWYLTLLTRKGVPTSYDLIIADCGLLNDSKDKKSSVDGGSLPIDSNDSLMNAA